MALEIINQKDLPYKFKITEDMVLKVSTKEIPTGEISWRRYRSTDNSKIYLPQNFELDIPGGITAVQIFVSQINGQTAANIRIQNFTSKKYWFDNINTSSNSYPIIKVTPFQTYKLQIDEITEIAAGGEVKFRFSNTINKAEPDLIDI